MAKEFGKLPHELAYLEPEELSFNMKVWAWGVKEESRIRQKLEQDAKRKRR